MLEMQYEDRLLKMYSVIDIYILYMEWAVNIYKQWAEYIYKLGMYFYQIEIDAGILTH